MRYVRAIAQSCLFVSLFIAEPTVGGVCADLQQREARHNDESGTIHNTKVHSPSLEINKLGDPAEQDVSIYLPPSYQSGGTERYPTVYLLHGFSGNPGQWITNGYQGMYLRQSMDTLIREGKIREMVVVIPNGKNAYLGSFYTNSPVTGNWDFHRA